jgi:hypothetical protein
MPKVYQRGQSSGGTGGTGGSGGSSTAVKSDRYIGTLGLAADAPAGSKFLHYTSFPNAEKFDWVRVTSTINETNKPALVSGEEWICNTNTEQDKPENWEIRQKANNGLVKTRSYLRLIDTRTTFTANNNTNVFVPFETPRTFAKEETGISSGYLMDITKTIQECRYIDVEFFAEFSTDFTGDRGASLGVFSYEYVGNAPPVFLSSFTVAVSFLPCSKVRRSFVSISRQGTELNVGANLVAARNGGDVRRFVGVTVFQNSGVDLTIPSGTLAVSGWQYGNQY